MTLKIALDSDALSGILHYSDIIYEKVSRQRVLEVYIPVPVYAEQVIYPGSALPEILDVIPAVVVALTQRDVDQLGAVWFSVLAAPMDPQRRKTFWRAHKMDCLIAAMALQHGWLLVTRNAKEFQYFAHVGLNFCSVAEFARQYLE